MDPITLRFAERLLAVLFGGMAIYLGYRLFLRVPEQRSGDGKFTLPWDVSIAVTRVGPGVFFALFGAAVVGTALVKGIEWEQARSVVSPGQAAAPVEARSMRAVERLDFKGAGAAPDRSEREARANGRALVDREIAVLNTLGRYFRPDLPDHERSMLERAVVRIKLALMKPVWGDRAEGWGDVARFEQWVRDGELDPPPADLAAAAAYYRHGTARTP